MSYIQHEAMMIILSAPSGGGKTSIAKKLLNEDKNLSLSISTTTRPPRPGEQDGVHYFFKTESEFKRMLANDQFLEHAEIYGNIYGTPRQNVEEQILKGRDILFDIDSQGAYQIMKNTKYKVISIFILPPNINTLKERLEERGQDSQKIIDQRIKLASEEMLNAKNYDYIVVNDDFDRAVKEIQNIITKERKLSIDDKT